MILPYYVYALKDTRTSPAKIFYIGKGTGSRAYEHSRIPDATAKGQRIQEIQLAGREILVTKLVENLTEVDALKLEAELISTFGVEANGGLLTNSILPNGFDGYGSSDTNVVVPAGSVEKAQLALSMLKDAVLELARANPLGITNADAAKCLGLQSDYGGGSKDYLSYSILGLLLREGKISRTARSRLYRPSGFCSVQTANANASAGVFIPRA